MVVEDSSEVELVIVDCSEDVVVVLSLVSLDVEVVVSLVVVSVAEVMEVVSVSPVDKETVWRLAKARARRSSSATTDVMQMSARRSRDFN